VGSAYKCMGHALHPCRTAALVSLARTIAPNNIICNTSSCFDVHMINVQGHYFLSKLTVLRVVAVTMNTSFVDSSLLGVTISFPLIASLGVILRFCAKGWQSCDIFTGDDWTILLSLVSLTIFFGLCIVGLTSYGFSVGGILSIL
jgi:hypothetical protein